MCKKTNYKIPNPRVDKCMKYFIWNLKFLKDLKTVSCCCGHGKYPMTVVVEDKYGNHWDIFSNKLIPRKRNLYRRDKQGYYYIPEVPNAKS